MPIKTIGMNKVKGLLLLGPKYFFLNLFEFLLSRIYQSFGRLLYPLGFRFPNLALFMIKRQTGDLSSLKATEYLIGEVISGPKVLLVVPNYLEKAFLNILPFLHSGSSVLPYKQFEINRLPDWIFINLAMIAPVAEKILKDIDKYVVSCRYQGFFVLRMTLHTHEKRDAHYHFLQSELLKMVSTNEPFSIIEKFGFKYNIRPRSMDENILTEVKDEYVPWIKTLDYKFDTIIDLGAQIGGFSIYASQFLKPNGCIHSFEPEAENFKLLKQNIMLNQLENTVTPHNVAVGDTEGFALLSVSSDNTGGNKIGVPESSSSQTVQVKIIDALETIPLLLKGKSLLKIDVEGWEYPIIKRMAPSLNEFTCIVGEVQKSHFGSTEKTLDIIKKEGFEVEVRGPAEQLIFFAWKK